MWRKTPLTIMITPPPLIYEGGIGKAEPWVQMEGVPLPELQETDDAIRVDSLPQTRKRGGSIETLSRGRHSVTVLEEADAALRRWG